MKRIKILLVLLLTSVFVQVSFAQDVIEVEAKGFGVSEKAALKDASRNAVLSVAGVLMESSTDIKNDEVIEDKIIAVSAGFIESFELTEAVKKTSDGCYIAKIKAKVKHKQLATEISNFKVSEKSFNMTAVSAVAEEHLSAQEEMGNFLLKIVDDYMKLWNYDVVNCKPLKSEAGSVIVDVRASLTKNNYMPYYNSLISKMKKMGVNVNGSNRNEFFLASHFRENYDGGSRFYFDILNPTKYENPFKDYFYEPYSKYVYVLRIELKNSNNEVIATKEILPNAGISVYEHSVSIIPQFGFSEGEQRREQTKSIKVELYSPEAVSSISKISAKIVKVDASQAPSHPNRWWDL